MNRTETGRTLRIGISRILRGSVFCVAAAALAAAGGCHSYHVDATVENRTGGPIQLLEVEYPSASFGANTLASDAIFPYRIQLRGSGPLKVQYTGADGRPVQISGPTVAEPQEGKLKIILLPGGKAEFHPELSPAPRSIGSDSPHLLKIHRTEA